MPKSIFWLGYHALFVSIAVFIIWISSLNSDGLKYSKVRASAPPVPSFSDCNNLLLELHNPNSWLCCDETSHNYLWICSAANDEITRFFSSYWAWVLPLAPLLLTTCVDPIVSRYLPSNFDRKSQSVNRAILYAAIILVRSMLLYLVPLKISSFLFTSAEESCWAKGYVSRTKCQMGFDFSDHMVLFCVQYIFPATLEIYHIVSSHGLIFDNHSVPSRSAYGIARHLYWIPLTASLVIIGVSLRCMMFTMLFFHNAWENVFALMIVFVFPYLFFLFGNQRQFLEKEFCN